MPDLMVGETARLDFSVFDLNGSAVTGLSSGSFTATLRRRTGSGSYASASETVTLAEKGNGAYEASFSVGSDADGYVYWLQVVEGAFTASALQRHEWFSTIGSAGQVFTEDDGFCTLAEVQALIQRGSLSATSVPTSSQVVDFIAWSAAELEALLAEEGQPYTVASGTTPLSATTDNGRVLLGMLRSANAYAAAAAALSCFDVRDSAAAAAFIPLYREQYQEMTRQHPTANRGAQAGRIRDYIRRYLTTTSAVTGSSYITSESEIESVDGLVY